MSDRWLAPRSFYDAALEEAERADLADARTLDGLDDEIAVLRLMLRRELSKAEADAETVIAAVRALTQTMLARHRLSPAQAEGLGEAAAQLLEEFGSLLREV